ncbi:hypothetical protein NFI96_004470 [Prochilodus magdalenae]|nr:hypothetical protein NFI96_004470 [Prochilodus magdalenae]
MLSRSQYTLEKMIWVRSATCRQEEYLRYLLTFLDKPDSSGSSFICEKCKLVSCLTVRIIELEVCIRNLEKSRNSERSLDSQLEAPDASGRVSASSTPAAEPSQRGEWVASRRHRGKANANAEAKAKANAKAGPLEHRSSPVHVSNRFSLLGETPAEKPVERALVIGDSILRHVKIASPLGAPVAVSCIPGARAPDIRGSKWPRFYLPY